MSSRTRSKRFKPDPLNPLSDPIPNGVQIGRALAPLDKTARDMEAKWGFDRLPELVTPDLAMKFGAAQEALNNALDEHNLDAIAQNAENLRRGWVALDAHATASGAVAYDTTAWPIMIGKTKAVIIRDPAASRAVQELDPATTVYTLDEVARLMETAIGAVAPMIAQAKGIFPGATVTQIRPRTQTETQLDDEIPF